MNIANFAEANQFFARYYGPMPVKYDLVIMQSLMSKLGNPQDSYKVIHVAGTSGKTSTAYYAAALLKAAGYKTGLTVSPHVDEINERVQIDLEPLNEQSFCQAVAEFANIVESSGIKPSWFEAIVAFAFWYFAKVGVDYAVIEVGLGGLLDATNVITNPDKVGIITDIGLDHTKILGSTLPKIATQKAGIIQSGNNVFTYRQSPEVDAVFSETSQQKQAKLHVIEPLHSDETSTLPAFQQRNYYLALQAIKYALEVAEHAPLTAEQQSEATMTHIPGRMEIIEWAGRIYILDGAHNAQKLQALKDSIAQQFPGQSVAALVGFAAGDDDRLQSALTILGSTADRIVVTSFVTAKDYIKHSVDPYSVVKQAAAKNIAMTAIPDPAKAFTELQAGNEQVLLVSGSFYLLNHIRPLMLKA